MNTKFFRAAFSSKGFCWYPRCRWSSDDRDIGGFRFFMCCGCPESQIFYISEQIRGMQVRKGDAPQAPNRAISSYRNAVMRNA